MTKLDTGPVVMVRLESRAQYQAHRRVRLLVRYPLTFGYAKYRFDRYVGGEPIPYSLRNLTPSLGAGQQQRLPIISRAAAASDNPSKSEE